ncbi:uncharacterized protein si:dkey-79d12.4 [Pseudorasbora parva]|uniref:uncharacterized protein si:dkey-79d12.4 n=1 Tax=Pseudorasbora parva TaxID=51549 RepID=UPI00351EF5B9
MEILPCEEVERVDGSKLHLQQSGDDCTQKPEYYKTILSTYYGFSDDSSDEDDYKAPLGVTSEESSMCCVCGDSIPFLGNMIEHFKTHTVEVHCHLCQAKFGRVLSLALHLKNAHPKHSLSCEICGAVFSCTWHLNGHMGKHRKAPIEVKTVVKMEEKGEISCVDLKRTILSDHSYCASGQAATNDTCSKIQKCIDNDTNSTNQGSLIKTETELLPLIKDEPFDTFSLSSFPLSQSETDHLRFGLKEENDNEDELGETLIYEVAAEEEFGLKEHEEGTDTDDETNPDSLPPGDTAYSPEEDLSSDSTDSDSEGTSRRHRKRGKQQVPNIKISANLNLGSINISENFGFQSDSPSCCYGKFANLEKHMDDCRKKMFACCLCSVACENEKLVLKHMIEKHPAAGYICTYCHNVFPRQDNFKNHICRKRPTGEINLPATSVSHLPTVPLSKSSGQERPSVSTLYTNQNTIKIIKISPTANTVSTAHDPPPAVATLRSTNVLKLQTLLQTTPLVTAKVPRVSVPQVVAMPQNLVRPNFLPSTYVACPKVPVHTPSVVRPLMSNPARMTFCIASPSNPPAGATLGSNNVLKLQHLVQTSPLGTAKMTDLVPQIVAMPQILVRPNFLPSSCVARPIVPVHTPSVVRPLLSNPARMTLRIPTPSNPPLSTQVIVSFSPTVNVSAPTLVSANKPFLRQTSLTNIRPLPVNVLPRTSYTFPTLVNALTGNNHPQLPPTQGQAPLQVVAMFINKSRDLSLQKPCEQSWRSKTIFPCRHCGAISRQPSMRVRHRYLHRGSRLYKCQCGRSFQQRLHLLRHQVQHAESVRFVCSQCGNTFEGAHKLTCHNGKNKKGRQAKKKCMAAFDCSCGQMFARPSALLWHMLKNANFSKRIRKTSQS